MRTSVTAKGWRTQLFPVAWNFGEGHLIRDSTAVQGQSIRLTFKYAYGALLAKDVPSEIFGDLRSRARIGFVTAEASPDRKMVDAA